MKTLTEQYANALEARRLIVEKYDMSEDDSFVFITATRTISSIREKWASDRKYNAKIKKEIFELQTAMTEEVMAAIGEARPGCTAEVSEYADMKAQHIIRVYSKKIISLRKKLKKV